MNFEKVLDSISTVELQDGALNFLDIKTSLLNQKLKVFEDFSLHSIKENSVFDLLTKSFKYVNFKSAFSTKTEIQDSELPGKISTLDGSDKFKLLKKENKILESKFSNVLNEKTKYFYENVYKQNAKDSKNVKLNLSLVSKTSKTTQKSIDAKIALCLKDQRLVSQKFNKVLLFNETKIAGSLFSKIQENRPIENAIKLNLKLFNDAFSQALKGSFEIFQARQIIQPPFGIVSFYIKEKDKKCIATKNKKRKRYYIPHLKSKKENSNKNFK